MTTIQIFAPALCCSSGVCGPEVDEALVRFAADVDWARQGGAAIERFNLAQQPMAFAEHAQVKSFLERSGADALPLVLVDGEIALAGRYPQRAELARWMMGLPALDTAAVDKAKRQAAQPAAAGSCCGGGCCG